MNAIWKPDVTVAAIIERGGRFLVVEEEVSDGTQGRVIRYNQPAGHLEAGESLIEACVRETLEETAWEFRPQALVGIYQWPRPDRAQTYLRFAYAGALGEEVAGRALDQGILQALWLSLEEIRALGSKLRSPLVLQCIRDYLAGQRYPLDLVKHYD